MSKSIIDLEFIYVICLGFIFQDTVYWSISYGVLELFGIKLRDMDF